MLPKEKECVVFEYALWGYNALEMQSVAMTRRGATIRVGCTEFSRPAGYRVLEKLGQRVNVSIPPCLPKPGSINIDNDTLVTMEIAAPTLDRVRGGMGVHPPLNTPRGFMSK